SAGKARIRSARRGARVVIVTSEGLAAGPIVPVELASSVDGDANRRLTAYGLDVMPAILRSEHEVARLGADRSGLVLDVPVDLALEHDPPLVVQMVVRVVGVAGRVADDEGLDVIGEHHRVGPRRLTLLRLEIFQAGEELPDFEQRRTVGHRVSSL